MTKSLLHSLGRTSIVARLVLAASTLTGVVAPCTNASASIVTSTTPIPVPSTLDGVYIDFATGVTATSEFAGFDFNPYAASSTLLFYWGGDVGSVNAGVAGTFMGAYLDLSTGSIISSASTFSQIASGFPNVTAAFLSTGVHTLGFRFLNEFTDVVDYGYLRISTNGPSGFPATILGYSYDDSGSAITVAAAGTGPAPVPVPEPESVALFAIGALAFVAASLQRQRRATLVTAGSSLSKRREP